MTRTLILTTLLLTAACAADNVANCQGAGCPRPITYGQPDPLRQTATGVSTASQIINSLNSIRRSLTSRY